MAWDLAKPGSLTNLVTGTLIGQTSQKFILRVHQLEIAYRTNIMETTGDGSAFARFEGGGILYAVVVVTGWVLAAAVPGIANLSSEANNSGQSLVLALTSTKSITHFLVAERVQLAVSKSGVAYGIKVTGHQHAAALGEV